MTLTLITIKDLIAAPMTLGVHCNALDCRHSATLDLHALGQRLGYDFVTVGSPNPLTARLRCSRCGSKDLGLILSSGSGYKGPSSPVQEMPSPKLPNMPLSTRKSRRRVRLA